MKIRIKDPLAKYSNLGPAMKEIIIASLVMNTLSLALPLSLLQVYDRIIPNTSFGTLIVLVLGVLVAVGLETFLRVARGNIISWMGTKFEHRLGCAAFERVLYAQNQGKNKEGIGDTLERLSSMRSSREYYSGQMVASLVDMPFVFVFLGMVYVLGGPIVWVPVIVLKTVFSITSYFYGVNLGKALRRYNLWKDRRLNFQIEILTGIHTIKSMGMESQMEQRYSRLQDSVADADQEMVRQDTSSQHISFIFSPDHNGWCGSLWQHICHQSRYHGWCAGGLYAVVRSCHAAFSTIDWVMEPFTKRASGAGKNIRYFRSGCPRRPTGLHSQNSKRSHFCLRM